MIFISQLVSDQHEFLDNRISIAGQIYQKKFIDFAQPDKVISIYPHFMSVFCNFYVESSKTYYINYHYKWASIKIINSILKFIFNSLKSLWIIYNNRNQEVWFYNLNISTIIVFLITKFLLGCPTYVILADYTISKNFKQRIINWMIGKFDGGIILNSNSQFFKNSYIMPGLLRNEEIIKPELNKPLKKNILFSGSLGKTTGFEFALDFFSKNSQFDLYITGRPYHYTDEEFKSLLKQFSTYKNIHYLGLLNYKDYLSVINQCDIALSLRDPEEKDHNFNFPSKILEYFSRNKIVISTKVYNDLPTNIIFYSEFNNDSLLAELQQLQELEIGVVDNIRTNIYRHVMDNYSKGRLNSIIQKIHQKSKRC